MQDQEWHEFIQDDRSTFPPDHSSIQVIFASGRLVKGTWRDGIFSHEYKIPETAITRWRYVEGRFDLACCPGASSGQSSLRGSGLRL
jgi:hypothetical protein